jgi:hypothetical protein
VLRSPGDEATIQHCYQVAIGGGTSGIGTCGDVEEGKRDGIGCPDCSIGLLLPFLPVWY